MRRACCKSVVGLTKGRGPTGRCDTSRRHGELPLKGGRWRSDLKGSIAIAGSWRERVARVLAAGWILAAGVWRFAMKEGRLRMLGNATKRLRCPRG